MPLARFVLILLAVVCAAALTVAVGAFLAAWVQMPAVALMVAVPVAPLAYVLVRVIADRVRSAEDSHYDRIER